MNCRFCRTPLLDVFLDLGSAPPSNAFLRHDDLNSAELWFPLRLLTCSNCRLVQVDEVQRRDAIFSNDYVYFSSYSRSWLSHSERYVAVATERLQLGPDSLVVEIASNDGYLLQYVKARGIPCIGIEPTSSTASVARERGIETIGRFFGAELANELVRSRRQADLIVANNVLAHVPDINDFVAGMACMLAPGGSITIEFPHLLQLVSRGQFDTVYHEHFSYFSLHTAQQILAAHGLRLWDVEEIPTHGGSLRLWLCHDSGPHAVRSSVAELLAVERAAGMLQMDWYQGFQSVADDIKNDFVSLLIESRRAEKVVAGYGAAAKGNTLLNYAGVRPDLLRFVADASPHKQGRYLPGSRIPVVDESQLRDTRPDLVVILPWNLRDEISEQLSYVRDWGGKFVTAVPKVTVS